MTECFDRYTGGLETIAVCHEKHFIVLVVHENCALVCEAEGPRAPGDSVSSVQNTCPLSSKIVLQNPPQQEWSFTTLYNKLCRCLSITECTLVFYHSRRQ